MSSKERKPSTSLESELTYYKERAMRLERVALRRRHSAALQSALYRIADISGSDVPMNEFFQALHNVIRELMYAENFFIALKNDAETTVSLAYFSDTVDLSLNIESLQNVPLSDLEGTLTGLVLTTGEPLFANEEMLRALWTSGKIKHVGVDSVDWLGCPLRLGDRVLGVMTIQSYDRSIRYHASDKKLLQFVSRHVATAVDRKQNEQRLALARQELEKRVDDRTRELRSALENLQSEIKERERSELIKAACYDIAEQSMAAGDLQHFFATTHAIIMRLMPARNFYIALYDKEKGQLSFPYFSDEAMTYPKTLNLSWAEAQQSGLFTARVLVSRQALLLDTETIRGLRQREARQRRIASAWLGVPLLFDNQCVGVLVVQSYKPETRFGEHDKSLLEFVSTHVVSAIMRRRDADSLRNAHDELKTINDELEQRIAERTQALSTTNAMLEQLLEQRKQIADKLAHDAYHDALTGLPNRVLLLERLDQSLRRHQRKRRLAYALLFLDLDRFKVVNDSLGHLTGDRLLCEVSQRLLQCVRPGDTVARLGGDEFCILLDEIDTQSDVEHIAERILKRIASPYVLGEERVYTSTSIGITLSKFGYREPDNVLRDADAAMYQAKAHGKNRYYIFDPSLHQSAVDRLKLESELRHAIARNEIYVCYQPVIDLRTGKIRAFEALTRWQHSTLGMVSPVQFIPLAEETGLINDIGLYVLRESAKQIKEWRTQFNTDKLAVSVNLSGRQLAQRNFLTHLQAILRSYALTPDALKLEITESILIHNFESAQAFLAEIRKMGIEILLDDFGTGYSSLNYLHQFPLDTVKIDRAFVQRMGENEKSRALLVGIRELTHKLGLTLVAEGIETEHQLELLTAMGVEYGQGYFFGAPLPGPRATQLLEQSYAKCAEQQ